MTGRSAPEEALVSSRLVLEPMVVAHAALLFPFLRSAEFRFIERPESLASLEEQYRRWQKRGSPDGREIWLNWAARRVDEVTYVGWFQATVYEDGTSALAYVIFPDFWRQGYAFEGCRRVIDFLLETGTRSIAVKMVEENLPSVALAEKLGFTRSKQGGSGEEDEYLLLAENWIKPFSPHAPHVAGAR